MFSFKKIWKHLWPQIKKFKWSFYALFLTQILRVITQVVIPPFILKKIIDLISSASSNHATYGPELKYYIMLFSLSIIAGYIINRITGYTTTYFQSNLIYELNNYSFNKLSNHSYTFFTNQFAGGLVSKSKRLVRGFERMHDLIMFDLYPILLTLVGIFYVMFKVVPQIASVFTIWAIIYVCFTLVFVKFKLKYDLLEAAADTKVGGVLSDIISNIITVKIFSARKFEVNHFEDVTTKEKFYRDKVWYWGNLQDSLQGILMIAIQIIILFKLANNWIVGLVTTGTFVLVQSYTLSLFDRLWNLVKAMTNLIKALTDVKEITDILDQTPDILDPENSEELRIKVGSIKFENVSFEYLEDKEVFSNFNLEIKPGERIGLVGHSGSGKSTITKLLLRFADIKEGVISIDDQNIRNITQDDLRSTISYVPQEPILFHRTIRENIAYARPDASEEEIVEAAKSAHAHDFISGLQHGYDTLVGERGVKLSGGERQRVAIARAMLKHSPILILDEATSSLDSVSESYIQDAFNKLMEGKTTIVIAHRLSTIQKMDRIIVLDHGSIAEEGTHKQLLKKKGIYAELWDHQSGGFIE